MIPVRDHHDRRPPERLELAHRRLVERDHPDLIHPGIDPAVAATVIDTVMDAIAHKFALERSVELSRETAANEAYALVMGYLTRPAASPA